MHPRQHSAGTSAIASPSQNTPSAWSYEDERMLAQASTLTHVHCCEGQRRFSAGRLNRTAGHVRAAYGVELTGCGLLHRALGLACVEYALNGLGPKKITGPIRDRTRQAALHRSTVSRLPS